MKKSALKVFRFLWLFLRFLWLRFLKLFLKKATPREPLTGRRGDRRGYYRPARKDGVAIHDPALQRLVGASCTAYRDLNGRTYLSKTPRKIERIKLVNGKVLKFPGGETTETMRRADQLAAPGYSRREKKAWLRNAAKQYASLMAQAKAEAVAA